MKPVLLLTLAVIPLVCFSQKKKTGWDEQNLHGKVRTVRTCTESGNSFDELRNKSWSDKSYWVDSFSNTGRCICKYRMEDGKMASRIELKYDAKGNITEENTYDENGTLTKQSLRKYDTQGNKTEHKVFNKGTLDVWATYRYTSGLLTTQEDSSFIGKRRMTYKYNDKKQVVETRHFDGAEEKPDGIVKTVYDDKGNKAEVLSYDAKGNLLRKMVYKYDDHNNEILEEVYTGGGKLRSSSATEYTYDSQGNIIRRIMDGGMFKMMNISEISYY